ncbi:BPSL1445 family SYLF domain-containing lipoprotein [Rudaea cellulosilytica]|uniref:BPSL1445 family SYLF domain-containing lipoprotein n=1 Tax=Rudaea cellulosilytica TaxID=540746 RepID=UPI00039F9EA4|nr:YSC84-related protein [Rudaea cellulosilytica]
MQIRKLVVMLGAAIAVSSFGLTGCTTTPDKPNSAATNASKRTALDAEVDATLSRTHSVVPGSRELMAKAAGVLVFPKVIQAGLVVGGEHGNGALHIGGKTTGYYNTTSLSVGLQAGAQSKSVVFLFMTKDALDNFRRSSGWSAGADASVAVVKVGANGSVDTTTATAPVEVIVLTNAGLMGDLSVDGTKISKIDL